MKQKLKQSTSIGYLHTFPFTLVSYLGRHCGKTVKERYAMVMKVHSLFVS